MGPIGILVLAFAGGALAWPAALALGRAAGWVLALIPAVLFARFLLLAGEVADSGGIRESLAWVPSLGISIGLRLDGFSLLFCLLVTGIGTLVVIYAGAYFAGKPPADRARFLAYILLFMATMLGAVLSDDLVALYIFWEATSILSFLLIGFEHASPTARRSALQSLLVTAGGGLALLAGIVMIGIDLGTFSLSEVAARSEELAESPHIWLIMTAILLGAFTKSAQYPFYFWLPAAMQAPTPASAFLHSATMVKLGIYLLARFEPIFGGFAVFRDILILVGSVTMLVGAVQALRAEGFKGVLAYSTIASLGILVMLIGLNGPAATVATLGFILAHALYKATLFFCAGTVLHATGGEGKLRRLGGLARFLPLTAATAVLASLSMAGLPPFMGFLSKEFLFQAQIESSWNAAPIAVAVLVNAVMVGVAGVVSLRPFFLGRDKITRVEHGETPGLLLGPLVLSLAGIGLATASGWITRMILEPAALSLYGTPIDVSFSFWHGLTPMLLLSGLVLAFGTMIAVFWKPLHLRLRRLEPLDRYSGERGYEAGIKLTLSLADRTTKLLQNGDLRTYLAATAAAVTALAAYGLAMNGRFPSPRFGGPLRLDVLAIAATSVAGAFAATRAGSALTALVSVGLVGFGSALIFMANGAPDLALTQFSVEALLVVLMTAVLLRLPIRTDDTRTEPEKRTDALISAGFALVLFAALASAGAGPPDLRIPEFFGQASYTEAFGRNVVNVILVDFRALDTLGETAVIAFAAIIVWALLRPNRPAAGEEEGAFILATFSQSLFWVLIAVSILILLRGHNEPGGGFVGGLVAALGFSVVTLSDGSGRARRMLRIHPVMLIGLGIAATLASGLPGLAEDEFLRHLWITASPGGMEIKLGTTMLFDLGVYLVVLGGVLCMLFRVYRGEEAQ